MKNIKLFFLLILMPLNLLAASTEEASKTAYSILSSSGIPVSNLVVKRPMNPVPYVAEGAIKLMGKVSDSANEAEGEVYSVTFESKNKTHKLNYDCYMTVQRKMNKARIYDCNVSISHSLIVDIAEGPISSSAKYGAPRTHSSEGTH
ncbi:MAG: hypothetical protein ACXVCN_11345 [Bdellovibrio sp.]